MGDYYYYSEADGKSMGPFTLEELKAKNLGGDTQVWEDGGEWESLNALMRRTGAAPGATASPAPPPPTGKDALRQYVTQSLHLPRFEESLQAKRGLMETIYLWLGILAVIFAAAYLLDCLISYVTEPGKERWETPVSLIRGISSLATGLSLLGMAEILRYLRRAALATENTDRQMKAVLLALLDRTK